MPFRIPRPAADEYAPFYARYVERVSGADLPSLLARQPAWLRTFLAPLTEEEALARYAPGKWSIKQVVGHLSDTERVMSYRALRISRADATPLAGFDENEYVAAADFDSRSLASLLSDFEAVRASTLSLLRLLPEGGWERRGTANLHEVSVRALAHVMAGHVEHHIHILHERYGVDARPEPPLAG
jgi:hypothetical protein